MNKSNYILFGVPVEGSTDATDIHTYLRHPLHFFGNLFLLISHAMNVDFDIQIKPLPPGELLPNGTWTGFLGLLNRSEVDVAVKGFVQTVIRMEAAHYCYPFRLFHGTFIVRKPEYSSEILAMFQIFSLPVWISIAVTMLGLVATYFGILRGKYPHDKIMIHVVAVFVRQPAVIVPSSMIKKMLIYSWVAGAMFLCLFYESLILSFFALPRMSGVRNVDQLANAVEEGEYQVFGNPIGDIPKLLIKSNKKSLKIIGEHILETNGYVNPAEFPYVHVKGKKTAYVSETVLMQAYAGRYFVFKEHFNEFVAGMAARKDFCCKEKLDTAIHRIVAVGLLNKLVDNMTTARVLKIFSNYTEEEEKSERKLNLIDVAPAFMILSVGYILSFCVLIAEIMWELRNIRYLKKPQREKRRNAQSEDIPTAHQKQSD